MHRRQYLRVGSCLVFAGLAGCGGQEGDDSSGDDTTPDTPTDDTDSSTNDDQPQETPDAAPEDDEKQQENDDDSGEKNVEPPNGTPIEDRDIDRRIGSNHVYPKYRFREGDVLNEGAEVLEDLGVSIISVYLHEPKQFYDLSTDWPAVTSLREAAEHEYYENLFNRPFDTYVLTANSHQGQTSTSDAGYFVRGFTEQDAADEAAEFREVTEYLLETYDGTGKEFIIQNWEIDNLLTLDHPAPPDEELLERAKRWLNARQQGIIEARESIESDVIVLGACEIAEVYKAMDDGEEWAINTIVPELEVDLIGYSSHGGICQDAAFEIMDKAEMKERVHETLDYIESYAPEPNPYLKSALGDDVRPVYLSEFGQRELDDGISPALRSFRTVSPALEWGCPYLLIWQLYDNEVIIDDESVVHIDENQLVDEFDGYPSNEDVEGWYLIAPDGEYGSRWYFIRQLLEDPDAFQVDEEAMVSTYKQLSGMDKSLRVDLEFETVVPSSEIDPDVPEDEGRYLGIVCREIVLSDTSNTKEYNIGVTNNDVVYQKGEHFQEQPENGEPFRWFGSKDSNTIFHLFYEGDDFESEPTEMRLRSSTFKNDLETNIYIRGEFADTISVSEREDEYIISI